MSDATVVFNQTMDGEYIANVTNWSNVTFASGDLQDFADNLRGSWNSNGVSLHSEQWSLDSITVYDRTIPNSSGFLVDFNLGPLVGTGIAQKLAQQLCLLIRTASFSQRPNRGRVFFGGLDPQQVSDGVVDPDAIATFENLVESWRDGVSIGLGEAFLRIARLDPNTSQLVLSNPVETVLGDSVPRTQRGRIA